MNKPFVLALMMIAMSACSVKKNHDTQTSSPHPSPSSAGVQAGQNSDHPSSNVTITESDWDVESTEVVPGLSRTVKTLRASKLEEVRKNFKTPRLVGITVPQSNSFELYRILGLESAQNSIFIHPKLFISSNTEKGSILGYRTGGKDLKGNEIIAISIPMALVNGLVDSVPLIGGSQSGSGSAISLPEKFKIPNVQSLKTAVGSENLDTLQACPKVFKLTFEGRQYFAKSPFEHLSTCPINQFFRVVFQAPTQEMKKLLESGAINDESVQIVTELSVEFDAPKKSVEISIDPNLFKTAFEQTLAGYEVQDFISPNQVSAYSLQDIESALVDALFSLIQQTQVTPQYSNLMPRLIERLMDGYLSAPFQCAKGGICRTMLPRMKERNVIRYSWTEGEALASPLESESVIALGAVANSSEFQARPSTIFLKNENRPEFFRGKPVSQILSECKDLSKFEFPFIADFDVPQRPIVESYCNWVSAQVAAQTLESGSEDGYFPFGANTTVYPGAWLKIDISEISEFTTAKTRTKADGTLVIESEVKDLLAADPKAQRTSCTEGAQIACEKYATRQVMVRGPNGDPVLGDNPCTKGDPGCSCFKKSEESPEEVCTSKGYQFQQVLDYECDPQDEFSYCPYYRTEQQVIGTETEWECNDIKVQDRTTFLCLGGCYERYEKQCKTKSVKQIQAGRQLLNCIEDDPKGSGARVKECRRPKYLCEQWSTKCSRYSVNESFQIIHEEVAPKWRPFAIEKGEFPKRFEDQVYLKFVSPKGEVRDCRLDQFGRFFKGNTLFIKIPDEDNSEKPCGVPLWNEENKKALYLPKVFIKNTIQYPESRLCGRTEYSFITKEIPIGGTRTVVPQTFSRQTEIHIGPVAGSCRADHPTQINSDLWFEEMPPVRFSGRVSVLGRVLESIVDDANRSGGNFR